MTTELISRDVTAADPGTGGAPRGSEIDLTIVTMQFEAPDPAAVVGPLANYVVMTRREPGCRNVDLCASAGSPGRFLVIEKWESPDHHRRHLEAAVTAELAQACAGLLSGTPTVELWDGASAHDLR